MVFWTAPRNGFAALGVLCAGLGGQHLLLEGEVVGTVLEAALVFCLSGIVFYTVYDLPRWDVSLAGQRRALRISVGTAVSFVALAGVVWLIWLLEHHAFELSFLISFATSLGSAVGSRGSLYAVQADEQLTEAKELAALLSINDRVLRHNIRNELAIALGHLEEIEDAGARFEDAREGIEPPGATSGNAAETPDISERTRIVRDHLEGLVETSDRTRRIVSIWRTEGLETFDLVDAVDEEVADLLTEAPDATVRTDLPDSCLVRTHPAFSLALREALRNAVEHNPSDVEITVDVRRRDDGTTGVVIADTGRGIPQSERNALENAAETPLEHTEGLGLWLIYWAVTRSGGAVEFADNDPRGTIVRITLPARAESPADPAVGGFGDES
ncbi:sensor histidine kinase [Halorubrum saccharovorum]|uniref:sensor histidine kinase n=1 Tax=Halorubrum saccharovorum TaxID=2248 RepID=UPI0009B59962|nr:HAMP domain-containing sensor histidine kinase [Halorubrum saccharovorum]